MIHPGRDGIDENLEFSFKVNFMIQALSLTYSPLFPIMPIICAMPFFGSLFSTTKPDRIRKSIGPISSVLKRQQPYSSPARPLSQPKVNPESGKPEVVTESAILSNFPRPNLMPTLHFSLFGLQNSPPSEDTFRAKKCTNCAGPHSTDFCPC
ncbi:hypothetical protein J3Q64DRAFT_1735033 [Phycomyces blakesleeanus]